MAKRSVLTLAILSLAISLTACASAPQAPPAAQQVHPDWLTGTWEGNAVQVAASKDAAEEVPVWLTFSQGGAWKAMTGAHVLAGRSVESHDRRHRDQLVREQSRHARGNVAAELGGGPLHPEGAQERGRLARAVGHGGRRLRRRRGELEEDPLDPRRRVRSGTAHPVVGVV